MSFKCLDCGIISNNPNDEAHKYCGACHKLIEDDFSFEKTDTGHNEEFGSPEMSMIVRKTIAEYDLEPDEIFALVFLANGRGHFMTLEAPADKVKFIDGRQLDLEQTNHVLVMTKTNSKQVAIHTYREVNLTQGAKT
jgi:hypothetical protein